ncbi:hypothetical protein [Enterococcus columbae]|uniref:MapZ extracellular domain-containing protein n=1 Tax=Enterococcus columbae DSM 7374 = ATCC 51263 TaxID=1121865 RepID=S1MUA4_9ENTE|nr:hypothetical protein [Enterococcus columbae]EOT40499.1 hypothetical protein OMW_01361 [Enterococcus columbae DSM 7374 = ATCC 51263]EOW80275.1 hypothetical protein I568_01975 [Enterococcus columbae DSM 7374 = ATCC 51263]
MRSKTFKYFILLLLIVASMAIIFFGRQISQKKNYEQRLESVNVTMKSEKSRLNNLQDSVNQLFVSPESHLLNSGVTMDQLEDLRTNVNAVKTTADDFQIKEVDFPQKMAKVHQQKKAVLKKLDEALVEWNLQDKINNLFQPENVNWQTLNPLAVIQLNNQQAAINEINEQLAVMPANDWLDLAKNYLNIATDQTNQIAGSLDLLNKIAPNGQLAPDATSEQYQQLVNSLYSVNNDNLANQLSQKAREVADQLRAAGKMT